MNYLEVLQFAAPETVLAITVLVVLAVDLVVMRGESVARRFETGATVAILGCLLAAFFMFHQYEQINPLHGMLVADSRTNFLKSVLLVLAVFTMLISTSGKFTEHVGEYLALILLATIGLMLLVSAEDLLMIFISLELASL